MYGRLVDGHVSQSEIRNRNLVNETRSRFNKFSLHKKLELLFLFYLTASKASPIASSDHGVGFDLDNSMPSLLHLPYNVPKINF